MLTMLELEIEFFKFSSKYDTSRHYIYFNYFLQKFHLIPIFPQNSPLME